MGRSRGKPSDITARRKRLQTSALARPRLADVARRAGVSTATVSRVLNTPSAVTPPLRASVLAAVETLGYVPHGPARALATQRSETIGAVIPTVDNAIFAHGIQALQERLFEEGFTLLLASSDYDPDREYRQVQSLIERGIDGLMLVGEDHVSEIYELLELKHVPYVNTWMYRAGSPHPCIGFDNRSAAFRIGSYLLDIGHREIAMVAGITNGNDRARDRVAGVQAALAGRGLNFAPGRLSHCPYEIADGRRAASALLDSSDPPTAIICGNDVLALGVMFECRARGVGVPGKVSITGFDDLDLAGHVDPPLTTMRVPSAEMGRRAAEYLLARLDGTPTPDKTELEASLIIRRTTAPPHAAR